VQEGNARHNNGSQALSEGLHALLALYRLVLPANEPCRNVSGSFVCNLEKVRRVVFEMGTFWLAHAPLSGGYAHCAGGCLVVVAVRWAAGLAD
jgi:hypothetical protein